jgi:hypothetical protein
VVVPIRRVGVFNLSAAGLAKVAAAGLPFHHPYPQVARQQAQLARQGHGLVEVSEEVS